MKIAETTSPSTGAATCAFSGVAYLIAQDHPVYIPRRLCGGVRVIFWP
jgi:hypothetical protein